MFALVISDIAQALPSERADQTAGFDETVRAVYEVGGTTIWVGGAFDNMVAKDAGPAVAIAALDPVMGGRKSGVTPPNLGGDSPVVWDFSLSPSGVLYATGKFTYQHAGKNWKNLVGLDPGTGAIVQPFSTPVGRAVFADGNRVFLGGAKLWAYSTNGSQIDSFTPLTPTVDGSLRGHKIAAQFRDIGVAEDGYGIAVGQFDFINGTPQKVAVKFDLATGARQNWNLSNLQATSAAFGIELELVGPTLFVAAGGSDFTAAYRVSDGRQIWKTDTSGSSQAVALWDANTLVVGGHFQWVAYGSTTQCGSNDKPNTACLNQPRLAAMNASTGAVIDTWRPDVCCKYNGVWSLIIENGRLHIGGEFTKVGGERHDYYARLSGSDDGTTPPPTTEGAFSDGFESGGFSRWTKDKGMSVQTAEVHSGTFAATNDTSAAWAMKDLGSGQSDLYARMLLNVTDRTDTFQVMRLRTSSNQNLVVLLVLKNGKIRIRNAVTGTNNTLATTVHAGWNDLQLHANVAGGSSRIELWLDGAKVAELGPVSLGTTPIQRVEIGHRGAGKTYEAFYDDVEVNTSFIAR